MKIVGRVFRFPVTLRQDLWIRRRMMGVRHAFLVYLDVLIVASSLVAAIPTSLVEEIKSSELRNNKVKRAHPSNLLNAEAEDGDVPYLDKPTAIKRGVNLESKSFGDSQWGQDQDFITKNSLPNVSSSLFRYNDGTLDDEKTLNEYEKAYRYGTNKDSLDEALENAVLKSELYGDPAALNEYRYYGADAAKKRRRRDARKLRLHPRLKREVDLTPEEVLALLSLYETNQRQRQYSTNQNYRYPWGRYEQNLIDSDEDDEKDESWLDTPVYPHSETVPKYLDMDERGFRVDPRNKRFMVAKRRGMGMDPTRELRYLNGPNKNDFYTLSQLLSNQKTSEGIPVYRRLVL